MAITTYHVRLDNPVNLELLHQEMKAVLGDVFVGLSSDGVHVSGYFEDSIQPVDDALLQQAMAVLEAHDWEQTTEEQDKAEEGMLSVEQLMSEIDNRIAWHEANPVSGSNAIQVAERLQTEWLYFLRMLRSGVVRLG